ncbi:MAG: hypothetical protein PHC85_02200 [Candidatus Pacebacteria bacterium]|nr:hypothetical protein [Candidatus Paceibacterota bacterium]
MALNLDKIDLKKEIADLKKIAGEQRGNDAKFLVDYIKKKEGENGFARLKKELEKNGYALPDVDKIKNTEWIPASIPTIIMVSAAKFFRWEEEDVFEMGRKVLSFSPSIKLFFKYFLSPRKTFSLAEKAWKKIYSFSEIKLIKYDEKNKIIVMRVYNFKKHPITCVYLRGGISKFAEIATGLKKVKAEETKCMFKGDPYHEYTFKF